MRPPLRNASRNTSCTRFCRAAHLPSTNGKRWLQISTSTAETLDLHPSDASTGVTPDATFEVAGGPSSLLSVSLSASQNLYTRRGTLVGVAGKAENTISTLSLLEPFSRVLLRIPFLYQRVTSTTPVTALISTKASNTAITVVHLDGTVDWMLAGHSLLAWTGQTLSVRPTVNYKMNLAHWGTSGVTGRGLLALAGRGSISELDLNAGESYVVHPSNVIAYSINPTPPLPYRFKSSSLRLQIPNITSRFPDTRFFKAMRESGTWQTITRTFFMFRTWARRTIWGDRLFLQFHGPTKLLLQTRASRLSDVLTSQDVNEIADTEPGVEQRLVAVSRRQGMAGSVDVTGGSVPLATKAPLMNTASIGKDGKVTFEPSRKSTSLS